MATKKLHHVPHLLQAVIETAMQSGGDVQAAIAAHHETHETVDEAKTRIGKALKAKAKK